MPKPGMTTFAISRISDIPSCFALFITEEILELVLETTNLERHHKPGCRGWKEVDMPELKAFLGLLLLVGVYHSRREATQSLWEAQTGRPVFAATVSRERFEEISGRLRFNNRATRTHRCCKQGVFCPIVERWSEQLPCMWVPEQTLTVDEQLVPFKGCCSFRVYMPKKPGRYGLKMWLLCDSVTSLQRSQRGPKASRWCWAL
ncbi:piggyBac transposable element-derived protein 4-like [Myripristis murdjan]|uniref:piggyBac transposable element-derived protein 4-like n=1 Tax=Myripristis murdjan TaxID=586833 RepID=UPI00117636B6|nr:piggyBac transposable element-derived protein 4-like [Myripristis murdjan]